MNVSHFEDALLRRERQRPQIRCVPVKCSGVNHRDASGVEALANLGGAPPAQAGGLSG